ncbi:MAG: hypothetical protein D6734_00090 [Candidatus Schekmanbacteria bacterium]|nr:MAG: hypothetical protein D6734_00090 [Candidatus Schekmanbacteria bacterium]
MIKKITSFITSKKNSDSALLRLYEALYEDFQEYTRVPKEYFCANLTLINEYKELSGCVVECGVWRGGMMGGIASLLGDERHYYLFDSFEGLPPASEIDGKKALEWQAHNDLNNCSTDASFAHKAMKMAKAKNYHIIKGWFDKTLSSTEFEDNIAILRLDADWYSSTAHCLNYLYPKVREGGLIIIDDYYAWEGCAKAVHDFLSHNKLSDRIRQYKGLVCYIVKEKDAEIRMINPRGEV